MNLNLTIILQSTSQLFFFSFTFTSSPPSSIWKRPWLSLFPVLSLSPLPWLSPSPTAPHYCCCCSSSTKTNCWKTHLHLHCAHWFWSLPRRPLLSRPRWCRSLRCSSVPAWAPFTYYFQIRAGFRVTRSQPYHASPASNSLYGMRRHPNLLVEEAATPCWLVHFIEPPVTADQRGAVSTAVHLRVVAGFDRRVRLVPVVVERARTRTSTTTVLQLLVLLSSRFTRPGH